MVVLAKNKDFEVTFSTSVTHDKEISLVQLISDEVLVTVGLDKLIKVWHLESSDASKASLTHKLKLDKDLLSLKYCRKNEALAFLDNECSLGVIALKASEVTTATAAAGAQDEELIEEDEIENFDMADIASAIHDSQATQNKDKEDEEKMVEDFDKDEAPAQDSAAEDAPKQPLKNAGRSLRS